MKENTTKIGIIICDRYRSCAVANVSAQQRSVRVASPDTKIRKLRSLAIPVVADARWKY